MKTPALETDLKILTWIKGRLVNIIMNLCGRSDLRNVSLLKRTFRGWWRWIYLFGGRMCKVKCVVRAQVH